MHTNTNPTRQNFNQVEGLVKKLNFTPCDIGEFLFISDIIKVPVEKDSSNTSQKTTEVAQSGFIRNYYSSVLDYVDHISVAKYNVVQPKDSTASTVEKNYIDLVENISSWHSDYYYLNALADKLTHYKVTFTISLRIALVKEEGSNRNLKPVVYATLKMEARNIHDKKLNKYLEIKTVKLG